MDDTNTIVPIKTTIDELDVQHEKQQIIVEATIASKEEIIVAKSIDFECPSCGNTLQIKQDSEQLTKPSRCSCGRKGLFTERKSEKMRVVNVIVQGREKSIELIRIPLDLVKNISVGDKVSLLGEVSLVPKIDRQNKLLNNYEIAIKPLKFEKTGQRSGTDPGEYLKKIKGDGFKFQEIVDKILRKKEHLTTLRPKTNDGGIDIVAVIDGEKVAVQCKNHYGKTIDRPDVDNLIGVMKTNGLNKGLLVCTGNFSEKTKTTAKSNNVELWDLNKVKSEMIEMGDFVSKKRINADNPKQFKENLEMLFKDFENEFKKFTNEAGTSFVPLNNLHSMFDEDWQMLTSYAKKKGYEFDERGNLIEYDQYRDDRIRNAVAFDIDKIATDTPASSRNNLIIIKEIIDKLEAKFGRCVPIDDIAKMATEKEIDEFELEELLKKLMRNGDCFSPRTGFISKI